MLDELAEKLVRRTFITCDTVLRELGVGSQDVQAVLLAGGSTHLPMVRERIAQYFGVEPASGFDPMSVVSIGTSLAS